MNKRYRVVYQYRALALLISFCTISVVQADDWIYEIRNGDNLWNITVDYLVDLSYVERVQKLNNIADPWYIRPGTKIKIPKQWVRHYPALIRVQNLQGTAKIFEDESDQPRAVTVGTIVMLGDIVSTDSDSTLTLGFLDGSQILLLENSRLKIEHLMLLEHTGMSDYQLILEEGRVETKVDPDKGSARRFQIKTPATVTSVRGTDYRVSAEAENKSSTEVLIGKVRVSGQSKHRLLPAGFGNVTQKGQEPTLPVKLLPAPDVGNLPRLFVQVPIQFSMPEVEKGRGYRVQIAKTEHFRDLLFDQLFHTNLIRGADLADGDYHLRVRAIDEQQLEGYNGQFLFTINARPEAPFLLTPKQGDGILEEDDINFSWSGQREINHYHLQIAKDYKFSDIIIDKQVKNETGLSVAEQQTLGKYFWRVAAVDKDGDGPFSDGQMFRRIVPAPAWEAPDISDDTLVIRAKKGLPGQTYQMQMSDDETFQNVLFDMTSENPQFEMPRPDGGEYFIRLRTIDPDGFNGPFAKPQSIDIPYNLYWLLTLLPLFALLAL